jgi:hypothetical protein
MRIYKVGILLILLLFASGTAYSQENRTEIRVDFRVNSASIDRAYGKNTERLSEISSFLQRIEQDSTLTIVEVSFCGSASSEGSYQLNHKLARARLETLEDLVRREVEITDSIITRDDSYISWEYLREKVVESDMPQKQAVLDIIAQEPQLVDYPGGRHIDHRIVKLQKLDGGKVWRQLHTLYFERMRNACVIFITYKREIIQPIETVVPPMKVEVLQKPDVDSIIIPEPKEQTVTTEDWTRGLYLKTNAIGLGLAISNIGAEVDLAKHWSFAVPVYYSALNYFTSTIKFRTLAVQPEFRYWFKEDNQRFFVGAHFGYAQYNIAVDGDYRIQDHNGTSPALGGGISVGYRMPIAKNNRWHIEFTLGAGVYGLHYDKFYNVNNGKLVDTYRKTYWGIDNAAVNISYRFDLKKRKK